MLEKLPELKNFIENKTSKKLEKNSEKFQIELDGFFKEFQENKNVAELLEKIKKQKDQNEIEVFENAWQEKQLEAIFDIINDDSLFLGIAYPEYYWDFQGIFFQGESDDINVSNGLNYRVSQELQERLRTSSDDGMSDFLLEFSSSLDSYIFPNDPETTDEFHQNLFGAEYLIHAWDKTYEKTPHNILRILKILKGAKTFLAKGDHAFYGSYMEKGAAQTIEKIENSNNYFIQKGIEAYVDREPLGDAPIEIKKELLREHISGFNEHDKNKILQEFKFWLYDDDFFYDEAMRADIQFQLGKYDDIQLRESLTNSEDYFAYSSISKNLAVAYDYRGQVDFFITYGDQQKQVTLFEILRQNGFDHSSLTQEEYNTILCNYKALIEIPFREKIEKEFEIKINQLSVREQLQFITFLSSKNLEEMEIIKKAINVLENEKTKNVYLKAFLSLEFDKNNGDKLIMIGNSLEQKNAKKVFTKIAELTDLAQEKNKELAEIIFKDNTQKELPTNLPTELLRKAHAIILQFSAELEIDNQASEEKIQKLLADLEKSRIDIEIIAALLVATKKELATQNISEIKGVELEVVDGKKLAENEPLAEKLTVMYRANNSHKSEKDLERLLGDFEKHKQYKPRFNLIYFDRENKTNPEKSLDNLVGFMRSSSFDGQKELPEGERYFGAMNIDPILQKFYFGENFLREIMEKEFSSGTKKLIAHVPENGPSHKITKLLGFETVAEEGDYRDDAGNIIAKRLRVELVRK